MDVGDVGQSRASSASPDPRPVTDWWGAGAVRCPDLLVVVRREDATILGANAAWAHVLGLDPATLVGTDQRDMVHPEDRLAAFHTLEQMQPGGQADFAHRVRHADGSWRWIWWTCTLDASGQMIHASGRDVTEHRDTFESALAHHDRLAEAERIGRVGTFSWVHQTDGITVSGELRRIAGLDHLDDRMPIDTYFAVVDPHDLCRLREALADVVATGRSLDLEYDLLPTASPRRRVHATATTVRGRDGRIRLVGTVRDLTDQRRMETGLRRALQTQQAAVAELEWLDRIKSAFLRAVSHELRTPVTVVRGMADTLLRLRGVSAPETVHKLEDALVHNAERLAELLEDLLDVDRLGSDAPAAARTRFDAAELLQGLLANRRRQEVTYRGDDSLPVELDRVEFERIVANLLDNARKYAPGAAVELRASPLGADGLRIEVVDDGPGIPADEREHVFEPFHRLDEQHASPGTGVGLALVAAFAEAHEGRAWVEPSAAGAHLIVELPGPQAPTPPTGTPAAGTSTDVA